LVGQLPNNVDDFRNMAFQGHFLRSLTPVGPYDTGPALRKHRFLAGIPEPHVAKLASPAHRVEFDEDQLILLNGERSTHFYLLVSGSVTIEARTAVYNISIQVLGPGDAFADAKECMNESALPDHIALRQSACPRFATDPYFGELSPSISYQLRATYRSIVGPLKTAEQIRFLQAC
jgi:hypothetical protein